MAVTRSGTTLKMILYTHMDPLYTQGNALSTLLKMLLTLTIWDALLSRNEDLFIVNEWPRTLRIAVQNLVQ